MAKVILAVLLLAAAVQDSASGERFVGTWLGTWDGAGTGGFELTIEKDKSGLTCKVAVSGDPAYKATCKALAFDGTKMTARYDFPPDERAEVQLAASFEDKKATGTWSLREKASNNEVATGGWTVSRK
jgi:hypothetical protein